MTKRPVRWFCAFSPHAGFGLDGWAGPRTGGGYEWTRPELWQDMAVARERATFDLILLGDSLAVPSTDQGRMDAYLRYAEHAPFHDPSPLVAIMAAATHRIGLAADALDQPLPAALQRRATQGIRSQLDKCDVPGRTPTLREIATRKVSLDSLPFVGTPQRVADSLAQTLEAVGGDGFAIRQGLWPGSVGPFVEHVVPLLQQRGAVRVEYPGTTLREHLQEFSRLAQGCPARAGGGAFGALSNWPSERKGTIDGNVRTRYP
jgi:alkanesulfonate monooxygenase SsuD/methylene tetrahydromethanopterin reductase-like flavin-dependent oxidoreductase (luciferase family)